MLKPERRRAARTKTGEICHQNELETLRCFFLLRLGQVDDKGTIVVMEFAATYALLGYAFLEIS